MAFRHRTKALFLLLGLVPVAASCASQQSAQVNVFPDSQLVEYHQAAWPEPDLSVISDRNREQLAVATELVDFHKGDFAGVYVDKDSQVVIVATSDEGMELATETLRDDPVVTIDRGPISLESVDQFGVDLYRGSPNIGKKTYMWAIDVATGSLRLGMNRQLDEQDKGTIEEFAERNKLSIEVYVDEKQVLPSLTDARLEDDSPYAGGFRLTMQSSGTASSTGTRSCSGGFGYQSGGSNYMLTAGHCFERGTARPYMWNTQSGACCTKKAYAGKDNATTWDAGVGTVSAGDDSGTHGDLAIVNVDTAGKQSGDHIWWDGTTSANRIPVTVRRNPTIGDPVCINGATSGADCGSTVTATNVSMITVQGGDIVRRADRATSSSPSDCAQDGDSGGSVVYDHSGVETQATAEGIVNASGPLPNGGCQNVFTGVEEAIQAWGGNVKFY